LHAQLDARKVFLRHGPADNLDLEFVARARLIRLQPQLHASELAFGSCRLLVRVVNLHRACQCLAISDLRNAELHLNPVLAFQDIDRYVKALFVDNPSDQLAVLGSLEYPKLASFDAICVSAEISRSASAANRGSILNSTSQAGCLLRSEILYHVTALGSA
jgi:hypothetical protein